MPSTPERRDDVPLEDVVRDDEPDAPIDDEEAPATAADQAVPGAWEADVADQVEQGMDVPLDDEAYR